MKNYRELYCEAIDQLGETYNTPAYASAQENYFKVFEELAAADIRLFEDHRPDPDDPDYPVNEEILDELAQEIEILHRVGYRFADEWDAEYRKLKTRFAA